MNKRAKLITILLTASMLWLIECHSAQSPSSADNGSATQEHPLAADFSLPDLNGRQVTLGSYRGKVILLDFWATWCEPCRIEIPQFVYLQDRYRQEGLQIVGVSLDDQEKPVREFYREFKMNYPVVMGNAKLAEKYGGVLGLPIAFVIGRDGRIYHKHIGETPSSVFEKEVTALLGAFSPPSSVRD
jgi:peroxiredoxin